MSFLEINADLKETNKLLDRLVRTMEVIVLHEYGIYMGHTTEPSSDPRPKDQPTVSYATDESTAKHQLIELMQGVKGRVEEKELAQDEMEEFGI